MSNLRVVMAMAATLALTACGGSTPPEAQPTYTADQLNALATRPGEGVEAAPAAPAGEAPATSGGEAHGDVATDDGDGAGAMDASAPVASGEGDAGHRAVAHEAAHRAAGGDAGATRHATARHDAGAAH